MVSRLIDRYKNCLTVVWLKRTPLERISNIVPRHFWSKKRKQGPQNGRKLCQIESALQTPCCLSPLLGANGGKFGANFCQVQIGPRKWFLASLPNRKSQRFNKFCCPIRKRFSLVLHAFRRSRCSRYFSGVNGARPQTTRQQIKLRFPDLKLFFLGAFFDDVGVGTHTEVYHIKGLEVFFQVCKETQLQIKLSTCDFLTKELDYLVFHIGAQDWSPSPSKVQAILTAKIQNSKDPRSFLGAANFYHHHIHNFTFSSAPLTEKLKNDVRWSWGLLEQNGFEEVRFKLSSPNKLGVPRSTGEMVIITDASDIGGAYTTLSVATQRCTLQDSTPKVTYNTIIPSLIFISSPSVIGTGNGIQLEPNILHVNRKYWQLTSPSPRNFGSLQARN